MAAYLSSNSYLGLVRETANGTCPTTAPATTHVSELQWLPVMNDVAITPTQVFLRDEALRGSPVMLYDQVQGVRHDEVDFKSHLYADSFPLLVASILGGADAVAVSAPYTHTIGLLNSPTTGSQPPSYSFFVFDGANYFVVTGAQAASMGITFGAEAAAEISMKYIGNPYSSLTALPTSGQVNGAFAAGASFSTEHPVPTWDVTVSVGGSSLAYIESGELTFDRKTAPIFTMGSQAPYDNFAGPLEVTGKFTAVVDSNNDPFSTTSTYSGGTSGTITGAAYGLFRSPQAVVITLTDPNDLSSTTPHSAQFTMSAVQFHDVKRTVGKEYTQVEVSFTATANTTDKISTGYSPVKTVTTNSTSTAYNY